LQELGKIGSAEEKIDFLNKLLNESHFFHKALISTTFKLLPRSFNQS